MKTRYLIPLAAAFIGAFAAGVHADEWASSPAADKTPTEHEIVQTVGLEHACQIMAVLFDAPKLQQIHLDNLGIFAQRIPSDTFLVGIGYGKAIADLWIKVLKLSAKDAYFSHCLFAKEEDA